ncbi:Isy1-like splicing factor [Limtongia smithiae]|uniref:Isy1-like splicing factor n=1 Tax=Limtongia smithiae TaxID=1125753 RepID=UPI0034CEB820
MARNSEKAQSMLYRFREQEAAEMGIIDMARQRRPKVISSVESITVCEKWRGQVVRDIGRKVTKIQDPVLSNYEIRDLNDEINKLMREKYVWEMQIKNLGGPNYTRFASKMFDDEGREIPTTRGYKYFGRARELPGVKELLDQTQASAAATAQEAAHTAAAAHYTRDMNADYYAYHDEDNPALLSYEANAEEISVGNTLQNEEELPEGWTTIDRPDKIPTVKEVQDWIAERSRQTLEHR